MKLKVNVRELADVLLNRLNEVIELEEETINDICNSFNDDDYGFIDFLNDICNDVEIAWILMK